MHTDQAKRAGKAPNTSPPAHSATVAVRIWRNLTSRLVCRRFCKWLSSLSRLTCHEARRKLAILIAQSWVRQDIKTVWNAVARSSLSAIEKQLMFNELWG